MAGEAQNSFARMLAGQGALLSASLVAGQLFSFGRNAILGYTLSKGDFGTAASITLTLQVLETVSDMAADRMIVQAADGGDPAIVNAAHAILFVRGLLIGAILWLAAPVLAALFKIAEAEAAFRWIAIIPVIRGLLHLDLRRMQRHYQNLPAAYIEVIPQAISCGLAYPLAAAFGTYEVIVWLTIVQAVAAVLVSHAIAERRWGLNFDQSALMRFFAFGWPVLLSALPMLAVYQFDRIVTAHYLGIEMLAAYTAAFMITMAPGTIIVKVTNSIALPLLSEVKSNATRFHGRFAVLAELLSVVSSLYLALFVIAGGPLVRLCFGPHYEGLGMLASLLAAVWSLRILALAAGTALMAHGDNKPILTAVTIRSTALLLAFAAAAGGYGVNAIAAAGIAGECLSIAYLAWKIGQLGADLTKIYLARSLFLPLVTLAACVSASALSGGLISAVLAAGLFAGIVAAAGFSIMPALRGRLREELRLNTARLAQ